jgi:putative transposase
MCRHVMHGGRTGVSIALAPTPTQEERLSSHCGASRFPFNSMPAAVKANLDQRTTERSYGITDEHLTPSLGWSPFSLQKEWCAARTSWRRGPV